MPVETFDVAIIGGGTYGCYLAHALKNSSLKIVLLEQGSWHERHGGIYRPNIGSNSSYAFLTEGMAKGMGGTSNLWGGQLIAPTFEDISHIFGSEFCTESEYLRYQQLVLEKFALRPCSSFDSEMNQSDLCDNFEKKWAQWLRLKQRSTKHLINLSEQENLTVITNGQLTRYIKSESGYRLVFEQSGQEKEVSAARIVVAVGSLESARHAQFLMELNNPVAPRRLRIPFYEHFSSEIGFCADDMLTDTKSWSRLKNGVKSSARWVIRGCSYASFIHFPLNTNKGLFLALKNFIYRKRGIYFKSLKDIMFNSPATLRMLYNIFFQGILVSHERDKNSVFLDFEFGGEKVLELDVESSDRTSVQAIKLNVLLDPRIISKTNRILVERLKEILSTAGYKINFYPKAKAYPKDTYHPTGWLSPYLDESSLIKLKTDGRVFFLGCGTLVRSKYCNPAFSAFINCERVAEELLNEDCVCDFNAE